MYQRSISLFCLTLVLGATFTVIEISAQRAQRTGKVTQIDAENRSFMVRTARGETQIRTTQKTVYMRGDEKITFEDLKVGDSLQVIGTRKPDHVVANKATLRTN